jgi:NAD(P)-dependent dehydrogenase (short-subunit alcohol dehydrogenase family)
VDLELSGRIAIVTGGSKGIGLATTRTLLDEGALVVAASRRTSPDLEALAGDRLFHVPVDLMDRDAPETMVGRAVDIFGGVDILVNNAGGPPPGVKLPRFGFLTPTDDDWQAMFEFNLFSAVRTIRAAIPVMLGRGGGVIINVSTGMARQPAAMNVDYAAANAGLNALTQALSEEYAPQGIRVNTISPGAVRTAWWTENGGAADIIAEQMGTDRDTVMDSLAPQMMRQTIGRLIDPQEIADAIAVLASPRSASTTGADFAIDAGFLKAV